MMSIKTKNGEVALEGLERHTSKLPLTRIKIYDRLRRVTGLCLLRDGGGTGFDGVLQRGFLKICEEVGAYCTCLEPYSEDEGNKGTSADGTMVKQRGGAISSLPSCQVSVEEKIQLFSFLRKGNSFDG